MSQMTLFIMVTTCGVLIVFLGVKLVYQIGVETLGFKKKETPNSVDVSAIVKAARSHTR